MVRILILITLLFPFLYKYSFTATNQFTQIPIILSFQNPNFLASDWYVKISKTFGPRTIFSFYVALTSKLVSLPISFFLHYLIYIFIIIYACYKICFRLFKTKSTSLLTCITLLFASSITIGGNILVTRDFSAPQLPLAMTLLAVSFILEKKYLLASIFFAISAYLHPLIGIESAIIFYLTQSILVKAEKKSIAEIVKKGIFAFFTLVAPLIYLYLSSFNHSQIPSITKIQILAFMRNPHHYVASSWGFKKYLYFFIFFISSLIFLKKLKKVFKSYFTNFFLLSSFLILLGCFVSYLATEVFYIYPLVVAQPFRLTLYIYFLSAVVIFSSCFHQAWQKQKLHQLFLVIPLFLSNLLIYQNIGKVSMIAFILGIFLILLYQKIPKKFFIIILLLYFSLFRYHEKFNFSSYYIHPTNEIEIAKWVKKNTAKDSLFLVPPEFESFRLVADRAIIADWKTFPFQEDQMENWAQRLCDIGNIKKCDYKKVKKEHIVAGYNTHTVESLRKLKQKYYFDYVISKNSILDVKKLYSNYYHIYDFSKEM